jgi:hypothetical protein
MSAPSTTPQTAGGGRSRLVVKAVATVAAIAALFFGANAITKGGSSSTVQNTTPAAAGAPGAAGARPPGMGAAVTGTTLTKLTQVATAKYPGTVERAMKLADGSYLVHVFRSDGSGEVHVLVSKDFKITGVREGGPPGGAPPAGQAAPGGTSSS